MKLTRAGDSREIDAEVISRDGGAIRVRIGDRQLAAELTPNADGGRDFYPRRPALPGFRRAAKAMRSSFQSGPRLSSSDPQQAAARRHARGLRGGVKSSRRCPARCSR